MVQYLLLVNKGDYQDSLGLFALDVLKRDNITLSYYEKFCDKNISRNKSIEEIRVVSISDEKQGKKVTFTIDYSDGHQRTTHMFVILQGELWRITPRGRFK
jgi:hypothetical protein